MENKTAEEFIREKIREKKSFPEKYVMDGLQRYYVTGEDCLRWSHEYAKQQQEIAVEKALEMCANLSKEMIYDRDKLTKEESKGLILRNFQVCYATSKQEILSLKQQILDKLKCKTTSK